MQQKKFELKIFCLNQPFFHTECRSILGDKYNQALDFNFSMVDGIEEASVIVWDRVISPKLKSLLPRIIAELNKGKVLLAMSDSSTLLKNHGVVELFNQSDVSTVELSGLPILPEDILAALETCYQKIVHV